MAIDHLDKSLKLPCGVEIKNRLAKSAMSENMSPLHHGPTSHIVNLYRTWCQGGAGLIITGNIMIDGKAIAEPGNVLVEDRKDFEILREWAAVANETDAHLWPQINHPGRQAIGMINKEVVAPSAIRTNIDGLSAMFKQPRSLTADEIEKLITKFSNTAKILMDAGFTGIQIHAAHGYLISQFLSPLSNQRTDEWGGDLTSRARFLLEVYRKIREKCGPEFPIAVKINSADFQRGGFTDEESMQVAEWLSEEGVDLIEISGGNYESPAMTGIHKKESTQRREAYFLDYVEKVRKRIKTPLMLTGGFRTVAFMEEAIEEDKLDIIGMARPFAIYANLPELILKGELDYIDIHLPSTGIKRLDDSGFLDIKWHEKQLHLMGKGRSPKRNLSALNAMLHSVSINIRKSLFGKRKR